MEKNLISESLSGFNPGDSFVNLLLPITDEIFSICDDNYEVRRGIL